MYFFYSEFCDHCNMLIDTIKKHNAEDTIKFVSIDNLRSNGVKLNSRIHSVPSIFFKEQDRFIFGKEVFDYLLLPGSGILLKQPTKKMNGENTIQNNDLDSKDPVGINSYVGQSFENLENENELIGNISMFDTINGDQDNKDIKPIMNIDDNDKSHKKLPSMEQIMKDRELELNS